MITTGSSEKLINKNAKEIQISRFPDDGNQWPKRRNNSKNRNSKKRVPDT